MFGMRLPFVIAVAGIVAGLFIAILFGVNEGLFKNKISEGLELNNKIQSMVDPVAKQATIKKEASKNWRYYQRFHFHATAIGAMSIGLLFLLMFSSAAANLKMIASYMVSIGGFLYPFVWLFAAIYGPEMGRHEAKEAFAVFGYMGGVFLLGSILTMFLTAKYSFKLPSFD